MLFLHLCQQTLIVCREAVQDAVERRGLSLLNIELNLSLSATPVPLTADISTVYGRRILLKGE